GLFGRESDIEDDTEELFGKDDDKREDDIDMEEDNAGELFGRENNAKEDDILNYL
ncbi:1068_t:CDS:1, partial [Racocetra fulgida]